MYPQAQGNPDDRLKPLLVGLHTTKFEIVLRDAMLFNVLDDVVRPEEIENRHRWLLRSIQHVSLLE